MSVEVWEKFVGASLHKAWEKTNNQNLRRTRQPQRTMLLNKALGPHIPDKPFFVGVFLQGFWVFGSLSSRQKLPEPKTKKTRGKPKKPKKPMSPKKVLGPDIPQNALFFLFFLVFFEVFGFLVVLVAGKSFRNQKPKKTRGKPKKTKKTMSPKKVLGPDIPQNALVFLFFLFFFGFFRGFWDFGSLNSR